MSIKLIFTILFVFILPSLYAGQDESLSAEIQTYLSRYRQSIDKEDIMIENGVIFLELDGRRTNHKSLLLLGFHSVGRQLQKYSGTFREVQIIIHYEMKHTQHMAVTASNESVLGLSQGRINPDQFFNRVRY